MTQHSSCTHPIKEGSLEQQMWQAGVLFGEVWEAWGEQRMLHHSAGASV